MEYRKWYDKGIRTSLLGFGAMRLKTIDGEIDEEKALKLFDYAYHNGVNYFDTAMPYTDGMKFCRGVERISPGFFLPRNETYLEIV